MSENREIKNLRIRSIFREDSKGSTNIPNMKSSHGEPRRERVLHIQVGHELFDINLVDARFIEVDARSANQLEGEKKE